MEEVTRVIHARLQNGRRADGEGLEPHEQLASISSEARTQKRRRRS